jgi:hypothetical protein
MREGRKREFASFQWTETQPPDPTDPQTFLRSKLRWETRNEGDHDEIRRWHKELLDLRATPPFRNVDRESVSAEIVGERGLALRRWAEEGREKGVEEALCLFNFSGEPLSFPLPPGVSWTRVLDSRAVGGAPHGEDGESVSVPGWTARVLTARSRTAGF